MSALVGCREVQAYVALLDSHDHDCGCSRCMKPSSLTVLMEIHLYTFLVPLSLTHKV